MDLYSDTAALRAAYTAMDQSYSKVEAGADLKPINNNQTKDENGNLKSQPFEVPTGYKVTKVIEDANLNGKVVIYSNGENVLVTASS